MNKAYLLAGGNMGNRKELLANAKKALQRQCGAITKQSALYETAAWGLEAQDAFLNQVLLLETPLAATDLLACLLSIEESLGRKRTVKYGPRLIDLDILFFNNEIINKKELTVPHPQIQNRRFALVPLAELAPDFVHPVLQQTITQLLEACPDSLDVHKIS